MTLSQTRFILETRMAVGGKSLVEHNEILGLDAAMKFINSTLINRLVLSLNTTLQWVIPLSCSACISCTYNVFCHEHLF